MTTNLKKIEDRIEKLRLKRSESEAALKAAQRKLQDQQRKNRYHHLASIGELAERANIDGFDHVVLLGAFMQIAEMLSDEVTKANCQKLGEKLIVENG